MDISFGLGAGLLLPSAINISVQKCVTGPDRSRRRAADGTWPTGITPSTFPLRRRSARWPGACNPSRSAGSGRRRVARGRHQSCIRGVLALRSIASLKELFHFPLQLRERSIEGFAAWIDDYGPLWAQTIEGKPYGFPDSPLDAVAHHRFPDCAGDGEADFWPIGLRLANAKSREQRTRIARSAVVDSSEIFGSQQTNTFRKSRDGYTTSRNLQ
jgi:hypothetical protein